MTESQIILLLPWVVLLLCSLAFTKSAIRLKQEVTLRDRNYWRLTEAHSLGHEPILGGPPRQLLALIVKGDIHLEKETSIRNGIWKLRLIVTAMAISFLAGLAFIPLFGDHAGVQ
jgi:hypothetical protein